MRRLSTPSPATAWTGLCAVALIFGLGCDGKSGPLRQFLSEPAARRALLLDALWYADNDYAQLRTARYANGGSRDWTLLPRFLPATAPVLADGSFPSEQRFQQLALAVSDAEPADESQLRAELIAIGEAAFFNYPAQLVSGFESVARSKELAQRYGLWSGATSDGAERLGGLLYVRLPSAGLGLATTCATCHADTVTQTSAPDRVRAGAANADLDIGKLVADAANRSDIPEARWGPGRLDTSPDGTDNPAAIPDLRVVASQRYLHHDATLRASELALALRIETLLITGFLEGVAPPIEVPLGIALFLSQLPATKPAEERASPLFAQHCARCHFDASFAGEPIPLSEIATDDALGKSRERGTMRYRTPTLRGVSARRQLLHDGSLSSLEQLLDPARLVPTYEGGRHGRGAVPGHAYGLTLSDSERQALIDWLRTL